MSLKIKQATEEDVDFILEAARDIHEGFNSVPFDEDTTLDTIYAFLDKEDMSESMLLVAFDDTGKKGVLAAMLTMMPFSTRKIAIEPLFWTDGSPSVFKALHKAYILWSEKVGADFKSISAPPNKDQSKYAKFYKNLGYEPYEYKYMGVV